MSEGNVVKVGMADLNVAKAPDILTTLGLGSCVGIALYDNITKIGGLAHIMLPDSTQIKNNENVAKFADTAIEKLICDMSIIGAKPSRLVAKIAGGAHMFEFKNMDDMMRIGTRNVTAVMEILKKLNIPILANDTGSNYGRTIELHTDTGILLVRTIGHGIKEI
ncbi:chemotaxis protein CheD [Sporanaerobium hydrogeniformans]|uniref:Chemotaxis protein CheD n=1 Tax=Sporanaerobium hydrogeniformans TaxID=3072179 RepID=A0AC61DGF5_9FIRM|nr:chemotaxis protein CheD [Sporanaerobium hydrogeniformans]PHV71766.1 chemotaxis protein CheD [Sporanaerobium hydrogeniformans]